MIQPYDDDDVPDRKIGHIVLVAVVTAALTTVATKLADWGIDELRKKFGSSEKPPAKTTPNP